MAYPTPPFSTSSLATSPPSINFDHYVHYAGKAAELAREAILQLPTLHSRISQLEQELEYWKSNHQESSQRAKDAQRQLDSRDTMIACFLDGDGCIFDRSLIRKGRDGGREAALALRSNIIDHAELQGLRGDITVVITLFLSKRGLAKALQAYGLADESTFSAFLMGLNSAHPLIQVTDVGPQKEAADAKLRENVKLYTRLPSCKLVLAGCSHDGGYAHIFSALQTESPALFKKLRLLHSYAAPDTAFELKRLNLESVRFEGLFEQRKLGTHGYYSGGGGIQPVLQRKSTPVSMVTSGGGRKRSGYSSSNGNISAPETTSVSPVKATPIKPVSRSSTKLKMIDPSKPLNKQAEPLCNAHYLSPPCIATTQGEPCRYSHSYLLTSAQIDQLRTDAKKSPCVYALRGETCKEGAEKCLHGHFCPREKCKFGKSCRFSAPGMHLPGSTPTTQILTTSDEDEDVARVVAVKTFAAESASPHQPFKLLSRSQIKRCERGEARFARYVAQLSQSGNGVKEIHEVSESASESGSEDDDGASTCSSID